MLTGDMAANDFTPRGLSRVHRVLSGYVQRGTVPGLVAAVAKGDSTHVEVLGRRDVDRGEAMSRDSIFRIASMSKPITAVAALTLVEDCVLRLDGPVEEFLPELADMRVLKHATGPLDETVPAERSITLRDLLTFRAGFGSVFDPEWPITRAMQEAGIASGPPRLFPEPLPEPDLYMRRLGELPLVYQPGEAWLYHHGLAVAGVLIARATGKSFPDYLRERILGPLGMDDTAFHVPPEKQERLVSAYRADPDSGAPVLADPGENGIWSEPPLFPDGGAGLVSCADDVVAFGRMLLRGGDPVLTPAAVAEMTRDQLTAAQRANVWPGFSFLSGRGWGYGLSVLDDGCYTWEGGSGTAWSNAPAQDLTVVVLTQRAVDETGPPAVCYDVAAAARAN